MKWLARLAVAICIFAACGSVALASASAGTSYYLAKIVSVQDSRAVSAGSLISVRLEQGPHMGTVISMPPTGLFSGSDITLPTYRVGQVVVISATILANQPTQYSVIDHWRLPGSVVLLGIVVLLAIVIAGWRGIGSFAGLTVSLVVIGGFILPSILHGGNAQIIATIGCFAIAAATIFLAHGFSRRTFVALTAVYVSLVLSIFISGAAVSVLNLNGIATEDAAYLQQQMPALDIQGVLLAGVTIGVLGVLDDIAVGQAAAVDEIRRADPKLTWQDLYKRGIRVGREHIASLINTLILAYAGSSFVFVAYVAAVSNLPLWLTLNSELVMEEVVRSLVGSLGLIMAVPIATALAAYFLTHTLIGDIRRERPARSRKTA